MIDERNAAEKKGRGSNALHLAEVSLVDEAPEEHKCKEISSSFDGTSSLLDNSWPHWAVDNEILGEKAKKEIQSILRADRDERLQDEHKKHFGLKLWDSASWDGLPMLNEAGPIVCGAQGSSLVRLIVKSRSARTVSIHNLDTTKYTNVSLALFKQKVLYSALAFNDIIGAIDVLYLIGQLSPLSPPSNFEVTHVPSQHLIYT